MNRLTITSRAALMCGITVVTVSAGTALAEDSPTARATATAAAAPRVLQVSTLRYANETVVAIVRMNAPISANGSAFFADPSLKVGQTPGANRGVSAAERIGAKSRHCYSVEARRLVPVSKPRAGSRTKFGFAARAKGSSGKLTQVLDARFARRYTAGWESAAAKRMGCGT